MRELTDEYFDDAALGDYTVADIETPQGSSDPSDWSYVYARTGTRNSQLFSTGMYRVLSTVRDTPLAQDAVEVVSTDDILDRMPDGPRSRMAVPSLHGQYLTVKEVHPTEHDDGRVEPRTTGRSAVIPIEYVIEPLSYDEVILRLIDRTQ